MAKIRATGVDEYILNSPAEAREKLQELRAILHEIAPKATESIKWGNPVMEEKRILFSYSAFKSHINFMPTGPSLDPFRHELEGYKTGKDTVQFSYDKPLPTRLIRRIAAHRLKDVQENDARWMY
jgi:uncharacterized protein YdhG (YjbR/CyaY superfamily)